jgi:hypothetical protein
LDVPDSPAGVPLIPRAVKFFRCFAQLYEQIAREVLGRNFPAFFAPEADQGCLIAAHYDPSVGATNERATLMRRGFRKASHQKTSHIVFLFNSIKYMVGIVNGFFMHLEISKAWVIVG